MQRILSYHQSTGMGLVAGAEDGDMSMIIDARKSLSVETVREIETTAAQKISERTQDLLCTGGFQVFGLDGEGGAWYSENSRPRTSGLIVVRGALTAKQAQDAIDLQRFRNRTGRPNADQWDMHDASASPA